MPGLHRGPLEIRELANLREDANHRFFGWLKNCRMAEEELDALVFRLNDYVTGTIDCAACANCCRRMSPSLARHDVKRLARSMGLTASEFKSRFLVKDPRFKDLVFNRKPCPLLESNLCGHYESRPDNCRSYPHLQEGGFIFHVVGVMSNYATCPIVFNVVEMLKAEIWEGNKRPLQYLDEDEFEDVE